MRAINALPSRNCRSDRIRIAFARLRRLLIELPPQFGALLEQDDVEPAFRGRRGRRQAGGATADDEKIRRKLDFFNDPDLPARAGERQVCLDHHAIMDDRHTGTLTGRSVNGHDAILANAHAAENAAARALESFENSNAS